MVRKGLTRTSWVTLWRTKTTPGGRASQGSASPSDIRTLTTFLARSDIVFGGEIVHLVRAKLSKITLVLSQLSCYLSDFIGYLNSWL